MTVAGIASQITTSAAGSHSAAALGFDVYHAADGVLVLQTRAFFPPDQPQDQLEHQPEHQLEAMATQQGSRLDGIGTSSYGDNNLGLHVADEAEQVLANRQRLLHGINAYCRAQGLGSIDAIHWLTQVHSAKVIEIDQHRHLASSAGEADALTTLAPKQALAIMTADCVPISLYQPSTGRIAVIHAGWQGLVAGIIAQTHHYFTLGKGNTLGDTLGSGNVTTAQTGTDTIMAWVGSCIGVDNYEVSVALATRILTALAMDAESEGKTARANEDDEHETAVWQQGLQNDCIREHDDASKVWLNLPKLIQAQLLALGCELQTATPWQCSYASPQHYSYRRQTHLGQSATGRMAMLIMRTA